MLRILSLIQSIRNPFFICEHLERRMVSVVGDIHDNHKRGPVDEQLELAKRLKQKQAAKECAGWVRSRVPM